jgi:hypothetical protein
MLILTEGIDMAGNTTVGKLAIHLSGNAEGFDRMITNAERRVTGFAAKMASPLTGLVGAGASIAGIGGAAFGAFGGPLGALMSMAPGGQLAATSLGLTHLGESVEHTVERLGHLSSASHKTGLSPEFLRSLQIAAGPAGDDIDKMVVKFERFIGKMRVGERDLTSNKTMKEKYGGFLDIEQLLRSNPENAVRSFIESIKKIDDPILRNTILMEAWGKSGAEAYKVFESNLGDIETRVKTLGLADADLMDMVKRYKVADRELKLLKESAENKATKSGIFGVIAGQEWEKGNVGQYIKLKALQWGVWMGTHSADDLRHYLPAPEQDHEPKINLAEQSVRNYADYMEKAIASADQLSESLRQQDYALGKTPWQAKADELKRMGVAQEKVNQVVEDGKRLQLGMLALEGQSPLTKIDKQIADMEGLRDKNRVLPDILAALPAGAMDQFINRGEAKAIRAALGLGQGSQSPSLALQGSQEFYRAIDQAASSAEPTVDELKGIRKQLEAAEKAQDLRDKALVDAWGKAAPVRIVGMDN